MNGYNFTDRVRKVLQKSREEAARLHHEYVGTEHILLGLVREGEGVATAVLTNLGVDLDNIRNAVEKAVRPGEPSAAAGPDLPYTSRAKKVLELAMNEAREMDHSFVGTEHLLLGVMREERGIGAQVLADFGVNLEQARAETLRLLGGVKGVPPSESSSSHDAAVTAHRITRNVRPAHRISGNAQKVLGVAQKEAGRLGSSHVDAAHIALAILKTNSPARVLLTALGAQPESLYGALKTALETSNSVLETGNSVKKRGRVLPLTHQAKRVLGLAMVEARQLQHSEVGIVHLLLAVVREGLLDVPNVSLEQLRTAVGQLGTQHQSTGITIRGSTLRLVGGIVFVTSGLEALWYAPTWFGKLVGLLGAVGGLLLFALWMSSFSG